MKTRILWIIFLVSIFGFTGCGDEGGNGGGPEISSITAHPSTVEVNGTSTLTCVASDPEGYPLEYIWVATAGSISGSGSSVTWKAPGLAGSSTVICKVVDSYGKQDTAEVTIEVKKPEGEDPIKVLADTTVVLSAGDNCPSGHTYCYDQTFLGETGKVVTIRATGADNVSLLAGVRNNMNNSAMAHKYGQGSVILTFRPPQTNIYRWEIVDYSHHGAAIHIIVSEE